MHQSIPSLLDRLAWAALVEPLVVRGRQDFFRKTVKRKEGGHQKPCPHGDIMGEPSQRSRAGNVLNITVTVTITMWMQAEAQAGQAQGGTGNGLGLQGWHRQIILLPWSRRAPSSGDLLQPWRNGNCVEGTFPGPHCCHTKELESKRSIFGFVCF